MSHEEIDPQEQQIAQDDEELEVLTEKSSRPSVDSELFEHHERSNFSQSLITILKIFIGSGFLAMPFAIFHSGLLFGLIFLALICVTVYICIYMITEVTTDLRQHKAETLQGLAYRVIGYKAGVLVEIFNIIGIYGCGIAYLIYFITFLDHAFCGYEVSSLCNNNLFYLVLVILIVGSLQLITSFHFLSYVNTVAICFMLWGSLAIVIGSISAMSQRDDNGSYFVDQLTYFELKYIPTFFGVAVYSCEGIGNVLTVRNAMSDNTKFPKLLKINFSVIFGFTTVIVIFGITGFRGDLNTIVLYNLPTDNFFYVSAQVIFAISIVLTYPCNMYPCIEICETKVHKKFPLFDKQGNTINKPLRFGLRLAIFGLAVFIAFFVKSFYHFVSFLGSLAYNFLGIIFPVWAYQKYYKGKVSKLKSFRNYSILLVGLVLGLFGVVQSFEALWVTGKMDLRQK